MMFVKETQPETNPEGPTAQASNPINGKPKPQKRIQDPKTTKTEQK